MTFSRWSAAGNAYLLTEEPLDAERVRSAVEGADGILQVLRADDDSLELVIWNPDGSQAEMSGNGTRIAARWLADRTGATPIRVIVGSRIVTAHMRAGGVLQELGSVRVIGREQIGGYDVTIVDVGNPHAVVLADPDELPRIGPTLETHPRFPDRTNVQVVRVDGPGEVTARVWERGVGETQSSGTSAVAIAAATTGEGDDGRALPGRRSRREISEGQATLEGPVERVAG